MNFNGILIGSEDPARLATTTAAVRRARLGRRWVHRLDRRGRSVSVGPHSEVHGANAEPGRIIWNIETPDVRGEFDRFKAAGATVVREPYTLEGAPDDS